MHNIHILQFNPRLGDTEANISSLEGLFDRIDKTDLIVLPELSNSGYNFQSRTQAFSASEKINEGTFQEFLKDQAKRLHANIVSGFCEREGDHLFNSSILVDQDGIRGLYRKIHLFMNEKDIFLPGNLEPEVYELDGFRTGMLICFDYLFPELWRMLALKGADLVCHPSNLVTPYGARVAPVQGIINRIFVATANRTGTDHDITFNGGSYISNPEGKILVQAGTHAEEIIHAAVDLNLARNKMITDRNHVLNDRRTDLYSNPFN
ncbi:MAG: hypothetical protein K9G58_01590 [Bacteroidales bacterium]|nr:hypothetical protein [Bacteroidales bacterium]MCF8388314.1 hypothetical protein [Bacteroidales bacterium]MCF8396829.1 hypothetical protein [Bacteroidales bacterium]